MIQEMVDHWSVMLPSVVLLGLAPFLIVMLTSYMKLVVVLSILRNALGIPQIPPGMVINGLALLLTVYIMAPVASRGFDALEQSKGKATLTEVAGALKEPIQNFLSKHASPGEREFFLKSAGSLWPREEAEKLHRDHLLVLIPAFTLSELTEAFKIGFFIYLPFVVVDVVVSSVLLAMGMMMVPPNTIATPIKLLLLVLMQGWEKLIQGLILTYR